MRLPFCVSVLALVGLAANLRAAEHSGVLAPEVIALADRPGVHNIFALGANIYSGSTPQGDEGFSALKKLGIRTVISVDGARPDVELAKRHGMRYVHLPHGYDGISTNIQLQLAKAREALPGPIYVHCHHGKHRGPTAAAVICMAAGGWSAGQAEAWLRTAGTSTNYAGLYAVVQNFKMPSAAALAAVSSDFPETAKVSGLVDAMVGIDERWENLKAVRAAGYLPPQHHPDIEPVNEAVILWEHYREAQRLSDSARLGSDFVSRLKAAEDEVKEAEQLLRLYSMGSKSDIRLRLDKAFDAMGKTCASCHRAFRDVAEIKGARRFPSEKSETRIAPIGTNSQ